MKCACGCNMMVAGRVAVCRPCYENGLKENAEKYGPVRERFITWVEERERHAEPQANEQTEGDNNGGDENQKAA